MSPARNPKSRKREKRRVKLDHRRRGYVLDGEPRAGFADPEGLSDADRLLVARWARRFTPDQLSEAQRALLAGPEAERVVSVAQRELRDNQLELRSPYLAALYQSLTEDEQRCVEDPGSSPKGKGAEYPLTVGDIARIAGASERQVRKWADDGLLPCYREGSQRRFYSAALIRAFAIGRASAQEKAVLAAAAQGQAGYLFQLIAATIGRAATRLPRGEAEQLASLAVELSCTSRIMADVDRSSQVIQMWEEIPYGESSQGSWHPLWEEQEVSVHTEPREEGWTNVVVGNWIADGPYPTKAEAEIHGREIAFRKRAVHVVHRRDGSVGAKRGYGSKISD